jgi:predicted DNA-binding mobile mystery protein A
MSIRQLAERLQVSTASAAETERREADATITLKSLSRAAAAMDCRLVYALIPEDSLDAIVRRQAEQVAEQVLSRVETTMALEDQSTDPAARRQQRQELVDELVRTTPRDLWDVR